MEKNQSLKHWKKSPNDEINIHIYLLLSQSLSGLEPRLDKFLNQRCSKWAIKVLNPILAKTSSFTTSSTLHSSL